MHCRHLQSHGRVRVEGVCQQGEVSQALGLLICFLRVEDYLRPQNVLIKEVRMLRLT
jgi:hypothetical protein